MSVSHTQSPPLINIDIDLKPEGFNVVQDTITSSYTDNNLTFTADIASNDTNHQIVDDPCESCSKESKEKPYSAIIRLFLFLGFISYLYSLLSYQITAIVLLALAVVFVLIYRVVLPDGGPLIDPPSRNIQPPEPICLEPKL